MLLLFDSITHQMFCLLFFSCGAWSPIQIFFFTFPLPSVSLSLSLSDLSLPPLYFSPLSVYLFSLISPLPVCFSSSSSPCLFLLILLLSLLSLWGIFQQFPAHLTFFFSWHVQRIWFSSPGDFHMFSMFRNFSEIFSLCFSLPRCLYKFSLKLFPCCILSGCFAP